MALAAAWVVADESPMGEMEMPPMGAPEEMNEVAWLEGTWDVVMQSRWDPSEDWTESKGVSTYAYAMDKCVMDFTFKGEAMGMPFKGRGSMCYDRETKQWQNTWIDNMSAKISLYTGTLDGDKMVMTGEDLWMGQKYLARMTTTRESDEAFTWIMENSMDNGENWFESGKATYTKQK
jgi:hypothetical protein